MSNHELGIVGLATMGQNLARNFASRGVRVVVYNRTRKRTDEFMANHGAEGDFRAAASLDELVDKLARPRAVLLMVKAGAPVDEAIQSLSKLLAPGDLIIDGGKLVVPRYWRRAHAAASIEIGYLGAGVSGGEEGALRGPSIMPGGLRESYEQVEEILTAISAKVDGVPCCTYIGPDGAGHFVKMVHNGIEYADIQLIAESYDFLRDRLGLTPGELAPIFREWNGGPLQSYPDRDNRRRSRQTGRRDRRRPRRRQSRTRPSEGYGRWTSQSALDLRCAAGHDHRGVCSRERYQARG
jgi:6-phosphogluconate dehydrogenase